MQEMTVLEAATKYAMHPVHLAHLLRLGASGHPSGIRGRKDANGRWLVTSTSVENHKLRTRGGGNGRREKQQ
jgi:hypothetical protein